MSSSPDPPPMPRTIRMYPVSVPAQNTSARSKRRQVKNACTNCQKACKKCSDMRPCLRCSKYGVPEECVDSTRKERKKGVRRGPYKKRDAMDRVDVADADSQRSEPPSVGVFRSDEPVPYMGPVAISYYPYTDPHKDDPRSSSTSSPPLPPQHHFYNYNYPQPPPPQHMFSHQENIQPHSGQPPYSPPYFSPYPGDQGHVYHVYTENSVIAYMADSEQSAHEVDFRIREIPREV